MKKMIKAASATPGSRYARKVLSDLRSLRDSLDTLYSADEELYDALDLDSLADEVNAATMFVAHELEGK